ncbi:MAG: prepilin-type N-terminal cleavage/methylation domain [Herbinix sp.]|nr:prepilin-type N-terminal cleavage/methylation domain [Herbinix sp.]
MKHKPFASKNLNNRGFSLVELIISIAILAIVMIPLMSNFIRSVQMNQKAEEMQVQSNTAADVLEGFKTLKMNEILEQFQGPAGDFDIITDESEDQCVGEVMRLSYKEETGTYIPYDASILQEPYYFAIHDIEAGGSTYDTLITMDPTTYATSGILNDYPMPEVINLDEKANGLLLSMGQSDTDTLDQEALITFISRGQAYAQRLYLQSMEYLTYLDELDQWKDECEEAEMGGPPPSEEPSTPPFDASVEAYEEYLDSAVITSLMNKTMSIRLNAAADTITYQIIYECAWTPSDVDKTVQFSVSEIKYLNQIENIYLFYTPSIFGYSDGITNPDIVKITNDNNLNPVKLFIIKQKKEPPITAALTVSRNSELDHVMTYTNLTASEVLVEIRDVIAGVEEQDIITDIIKKEKQDRIYQITVNIYEAVNGGTQDKYKNTLYTLESTKEE